MHTYVCACMHAWEYEHLGACTCMCFHMYIDVCAHACVDVHFCKIPQQVLKLASLASPPQY